MKTLVLIRHATAESEHFKKSDFDRQLEPLGLAEAEKLGKFIRSKKAEPALLLCSEAARTKATAEIASAQWAAPPAMDTHMALYNANYKLLLQHIAGTEAQCACMALVGHNPGISQLASILSAGGGYQMAPASAVCLQFNILNWNEIKAGTGKEIWYFYP